MVDTSGRATTGTSFAAESPWIRRAAQTYPRVRLGCLPFAGGGASVYQRLPALLPPTVEVIAVQLPGREDRSREDPPTNLRSVVAAVAIALYPYSSLPLAIYGHCAGALLGYEVTHELHRRYGVRVHRLLAGAQGAPHLSTVLGGRTLHHLEDAKMLAEIERRGGLPAPLRDHPELLAMLLPLLRSDFSLWENYVHHPRPPMPVPVTTVRGADDEFVDAAAASAWGNHTSQAADDVVVPGGHYFITSAGPETAAVLADAALASIIPGMRDERRIT